MAKTKINFDTVRKLARALPGVEESTAYGKAALKVHGKLLACVPTHRTAEPDSIVVRVDPEQCASFLAEAPDIYYLPDHYVGYNCVLVRLAHITPEALRDLIRSAHRFVTRKSARPSR
jgi:hypothetical protein